MASRPWGIQDSTSAGRSRRLFWAPSPGPSRSERIDRVVTHRVLGPLIYLAVMATIFWAVYAWAEPFMNWIEAGTEWLGAHVAGRETGVGLRYEEAGMSAPPSS